MEETRMMLLRNQPIARLTCHAWEIGGQLRKLANRFPQSRENILGYSERLETISRSLLSLFPILSSLPKRDLTIARHHLGTCHRFLYTLHGLQELLAICTSNSKLQPVILLSGKRLSLLSEDADLQFQQALSSMEASTRLAIYSVKESFKHNGELCSDLEVLFEWVAASLRCPSTHLTVGDTASSQDCLTFAYEELAVPTDTSSPEKEGHQPFTRTNVTDLHGIRSLQIKPVTSLLSSPVFGYFPDLGSLSWTDNRGEHKLVQTPSEVDDPNAMTQNSLFKMVLNYNQLGDQASYAEKLIDYNWALETKRSAGSLVLHDTLMTSHNHGRIKEREVLLFQNRLFFLRKKDHLRMVIWDISLWKDVILIAYNPKSLLQQENKDTGSLTVYWKTEVAGQPRVSGVKIYFKELSSLELWAAFLALDPKLPEPAVNTPHDGSTSVDIQATSLVPEDTQIQEPISVSKKDTKIGGKTASKSVWSAIPQIKKLWREARSDMGLRDGKR